MRRLAILSIAIMVLANGIVFANGDNESRFLSNRGLSEAQINEVRQVYSSYLSMRRGLNAELELIRAEIGEMLTDRQPDLGAIEAKLSEGADKQTELRLAQIEAELDVRRIVGDDVWASIIGRRRRGFSRSYERRRGHFNDDRWLFYRNRFEHERGNEESATEGLSL